MSIITTAPAVPSRVFALYSSLLPSTTGEPKDRLESWATPPSIRTRGATDDGGERSTELFSSALREAKNLGLLEEDGNRVKVTDEARGTGAKVDPEIRFKSHLVKVLFDTNRAEAAQQTSFAMALSWFMGRSPLEPMGFGASFQNDLASLLGENSARTELTSINRFQNFVYWARYLGFATIVGTKEARWVIPDPISAIRAALPCLFSEAAELTIDAFVAGLAQRYPVFEGGVARLAIEELSTSTESDTSGRRLSIATSLALHRLHSADLISLVIRADAPVVILDLGGAERRVSHVVKKAD